MQNKVEKLKKLASLIALLLASDFTYSQSDTTPSIPFAGMDLTWINGQNRQKEFPLTFTKNNETILTGQVYFDGYFNYNFANPIDNTQTISSTIGRHKEFTPNLACFGIESNYKNTIGRVVLQFGQMASIVPDYDGSVNRGQYTGVKNLRYIREAAAGYHFNKWYGINVEMGIFMSFVGLESYTTQENWNYQRSMVSEMTPFYFTGARIQMFPTKKLRQEVWLLNGWQSYNSFSTTPGIGSSTYYRPTENLQINVNAFLGKETQNPDTFGNQSNRTRFHVDNGIVARYYKQPNSKLLSQAAFSLNTHYGFQTSNERNDIVNQSENFMAGTSLAHRLWFNKNKFALTFRGDYVTNPSVINGLNSTGYLAYSPALSGGKPNNYDVAIANNQKLKMFQFAATFDVMPNDFVTFRLEYVYRKANLPYFAGHGGTTSASGWANGPTTVLPWAAQLQQKENRLTLAVNFRL